MAAEGSSGAPLNPPDPRDSPFLFNSWRVSEIINRLSACFGSRAHLRKDNVDFLGMCISLSRCLDFAIANHQQVDRKDELPSLVRQVCQCKKDDTLLAVIMILMISVKNACDEGWFSSKGSEELKNMADEIAKNFCNAPNLEADHSVHLPVISTVMSRFYPRMKFGDVLFCFEAKAGSDAYVKPFLISKKQPPPEGKVRLFVIHLDMIETSSCLISPAKVNFLVNGKGVAGRISPFVDTGPQIPTLVSNFLKYGSNLVQALGEFNGNYLVAVAHTIETQEPDSSVLQEYEHHAPMSLESDSELKEGPSRISLKCPISLSRIKTPVKGRLCKHTQCFDFDNYMDINSRKPSWRCPCCNQHVCFTDLRIDQKMVQVLKETATTVTEVIVSSDWSWKPVIESNDSTQKPDVRDGKSPSLDRILDLTHTDDAMCINDDIKQPQATVQTQSMVQPHGLEPGLNDGHVLDDSWADVYSYSFEPSSAYFPFNGLSTASIPNFTTSTSPSLTQPSTSPFGQHESSQNSSAFPGSQSVFDPILSPNNQFGNYPTVSNELGRFSHQVPNPIQTLPLQTSISVPRQMPQNVPSTISWRQATSAATAGAPVRPPSSTQNIARQDNTTSNSYRVPSEHQSRMHPTHSTHQTVGHHPYNRPQPSSSRHHPTVFSQGITLPTHTIAAANRTAHMFSGPPPARPSVLRPSPDTHNMPGLGIRSPRNNNLGVSSLSFSTGNNNVSGQNGNATADRMRGASTGQSNYVVDPIYNQFVVESGQQAQGVRPVSNMNAASSSSLNSNLPDFSNRRPPAGSSGGLTR